jgi:hypothetical protein
MAMDNRTMFEFDMAHSLTTALPGSWLAASPELRHYQGVVWYQRHFDAPSNRKGATSCVLARPIMPRRLISTANRWGGMRVALHPLPLK